VARRTVLEKVSGLVVEAGMIVFAVIVALGVEEWRTERGLRQFAEQVQLSVHAEIEANLAELEATGPTLDSTRATLESVLAEGDMTLLGSALSFALPEISSAAWRAAQVSEAAPYLDYDWVIEVARAYESHEVYARIGEDLVRAMSHIIGPGPNLERVSAIYGPLVILSDVHGQVAARFEAILDGDVDVERGDADPGEDPPTG
jgi:hypothetical protein